MKLDHGGAALKVSSSHDFETAGFNIKASPIAFQVLSSGLYQDKVAAVIRELSTNAYDGHRLREMGVKNSDGTWAVAPIAGRTKLPFKVELPSSWNPVFSVRDYGVGLDHAGIMNLYTTYFGSTKSDSNEFVGALGLGSKSPFSMASSFLVISFYNGVKRTYTAMIGEDGFPTIVKMDEVDTTEENGLEVRVTVDPSQVHMFKDRAAKIYAFFDVPPNVPGLTITRPEYEQKTKDWGIRKTGRFGYSNSMPTGVIMGQICYPITLSALEGKIKPHIYSLLQKYSGTIDVFCNMADVEFQASREALSYTDKTFKFFDGVMEDFYREMRDKAIAGLNACTTYVEAILYMRGLDSLTKQILEADQKAGKLLFRGSAIDWTAELRISGTCKLDVLGTVFGDTTKKDPKNPPRFVPKFKLINPYNGETQKNSWIRDIDYDKGIIKYGFEIPYRSSDVTKIALNDCNAPLYQIRDHLSRKSLGNNLNTLYLIDKKHEDVADFIAKVYEGEVSKMSTWNMSAATIAQFSKLARSFTPSLGSTSVYDLTDKMKSDAELKEVRYYICTNGNAHNFDDPLKKPDINVTDYVCSQTVNNYLLAMQRYSFLKDKEKVAIVAKTKEADFKKLMPNIKHISEAKDTVKWSSFTPEKQREISAVVFRRNLKDNRFDYQVEEVTAEYSHFLKELQSLPHSPAPLRKWATDTLNSYKKLAAEVYAKLSKNQQLPPGTPSYYAVKRPVDPKPFVDWIAVTFKDDLIDFQPDIDALALTEKLLVDVFPVFALLRQTYYTHTSASRYDWTPEMRELIGKMIKQEIDALKVKLTLA